jgi:hypothetical protein
VTTVTAERKFGTSRLKHTTAVPGRVFAPRDLPDLGIHFHINYLRRMWEEGNFPKPIKLSPRRIAWREADLLAWINSRNDVDPRRKRKTTAQVEA